jgi:hypothetical protein
LFSSFLHCVSNHGDLFVSKSDRHQGSPLQHIQLFCNHIYRHFRFCRSPCCLGCGSTSKIVELASIELRTLNNWTSIWNYLSIGIITKKKLLPVLWVITFPESPTLDVVEVDSIVNWSPWKPIISIWNSVLSAVPLELNYCCNIHKLLLDSELGISSILRCSWTKN